MNKFKEILDKNRNLSEVIQKEIKVRRQTIYNYKTGNTKPDFYKAKNIYELLIDLKLIDSKTHIDELFG